MTPTHPKPINIDDVRKAYKRFSKTFDSLLMATADDNSIPNASYAAYIETQGDYYVYISELATHTRNINLNRQVSLLFIENEEGASHPFARERLTLQCDAKKIFRDRKEFGDIMELFSQKFGTFMNMIKDLQDFHLYRLHPLKGTYVQGFARAFTLDGKDLEKLQHINDKGHRTCDPT